MKTLKFAAALAVASASALAADEAKTNSTEAVELPTVVVEASRTGRTAAEIPAAVQIITASEIAASGAKDVVDLLEKKVPSLDIAHVGAANPAFAQIAPRGYGENGFGRLLVIVDGERLNNPDMNSPNLAQIDLGAVRRIEILQGSQNVLHGDAASAGVINIVTEPDGYDTHGRIELHGGSWGTIGGGVSLRGGVEDWGTQYWMNGGWEHSDGYRHNNGHDIYSLGGGVKQNFDGGSYVRVSAFYNDTDADLAGAITKDQWKRNPKTSDGYDDSYRRTTYGLNATAYGVLNEDNAVRLAQTVSRRHLQSRGYGYWHTDYDIYSYSFTPEWINTADVFGLGNELIVGATFRYDRNDAANWGRSSYGYSHYKYDFDRQSMGFYAQDTLHLTDTLAVQAGARYERAWNKCTMAARDGRTYDLTAFDAAVLWNPVDDLKTYLRFSRFYRMPFIDEVAYASRDDLISPERGWRVDGGVDWTFLEDFNFAGNAFVSRTRNEIFYDPNFLYYSGGWPSFGDNVNAPDPVMREGFDVRLAWERDKVAGASLAYGFVNAEFDGGEYDGNEVPLVSESVVLANARVWLWDDCFVFGGYRYQSERRSISDFANTAEKLKGYGIFHAGVQYAPHYDCVKGLVFRLTVNNLFDKEYCDYSTYGTAYYPAAGRSWMLSVAYEF